jgi:hypothetical protein
MPATAWTFRVQLHSVLPCPVAQRHQRREARLVDERADKFDHPSAPEFGPEVAHDPLGDVAHHHTVLQSSRQVDADALRHRVPVHADDEVGHDVHPHRGREAADSSTGVGVRVHADLECPGPRVALLDGQHVADSRVVDIVDPVDPVLRAEVPPLLVQAGGCRGRGRHRVVEGHHHPLRLHDLDAELRDGWAYQ